VALIKNLKLAVKAYLSKNEQKHRVLKESAEKAENTWDILKNEFPEEIKLLLKKDITDQGFNIALQNDDSTPMEYVVFVLEKLFGIEQEMAIKKMLEVHEKGSSIIVNGVSNEAAIKLVFYLLGHANSRGYPLQWIATNA
jgi:ATP-dependent Clp protease adaptor protein ClpS